MLLNCKGGKILDKRPLIGISIFSIVLIILTSFSNVIGYQAVQESNQAAIDNRVNQRELLFQAICDIANNKDIQRIILKSQMSRGIFPTSEMPVLTKNQIRQMYFIGLILSKIISKTRLQSITGKYQFDNQEIQKEISTVIEKDVTLNWEISQLQNSECDCENEDENDWPFPVLCVILWSIFSVGVSLGYYFVIGQVIGIVAFILIMMFRCMIYP